MHHKGHGMFYFLKQFEHTIDNQGESLVITIKGEKEEIAKLERKLKAMHELMDDCECCC